MKIRRYNLVYFLKLAFNGIFRNGVMTIASVIVLVSCLLVTGTSWLLIKNIDVNLDELEGYNKIVVFVNQDADDYLVSEIGDKLKALDGVTDVVYQSKDDALQELIDQYGAETEIFEMFRNDNPLKDEYSVSYNDSSKVDTLVYQIEQIDGIAKVNNRRDVALKIDRLKSIVQLVFTWLLVLLFMVSLFVIMNTVKLNIFARREEIAIMKYVGATRIYVGLPYILEGIIIGLFASTGSFFLQWYLYQHYAVELLGSYNVLTVLPFESVRLTLIIIFAVIGIGTGIFASAISLRKYNKA